MFVVTIGLLQMEFTIPGSRSLKDKRRAMGSLKTQLRNRFNCSVAEVDFKDKWGRSRLAVCVVSDDAAHANTQLNKVVNFASNHRLAFLENVHIEMM